MMTSLAREIGLCRLSEKVGDIEVLPVTSSATDSSPLRPVDQRMDGARIGRALGAQHLRRLAGEGGELHLAVDMLGEIARQRRLAGAGIAEQPENLRPAGLQPSRDRLQRVILLGREFHRPDDRIRDGRARILNFSLAPKRIWRDFTAADRSPAGSACRAAWRARRAARPRPSRSTSPRCGNALGGQQLFQRRAASARNSRCRPRPHPGCLTSADSASAHSLQENSPRSCSATVMAKASACQGSAKTGSSIAAARRRSRPHAGSR